MIFVSRPLEEIEGLVSVQSVPISDFEPKDTPPPPLPSLIPGKPLGWFRTHQELWERRDLQLVGVLALREIILALERQRMKFKENENELELTAGSVCRQNCFTVEVNTFEITPKTITYACAVRSLFNCDFVGTLLQSFKYGIGTKVLRSIQHVFPPSPSVVQCFHCS